MDYGLEFVMIEVMESQKELGQLKFIRLLVSLMSSSFRAFFIILDLFV